MSATTTPTRTPKGPTDIQDTIANHSSVITDEEVLEDEEIMTDTTPKVKKTVTGKENSNRAGRLSRDNRVCDKNPFMVSFLVLEYYTVGQKILKSPGKKNREIKYIKKLFFVKLHFWQF